MWYVSTPSKPGFSHSVLSVLSLNTYLHIYIYFLTNIDFRESKRPVELFRVIGYGSCCIAWGLSIFQVSPRAASSPHNQGLKSDLPGLTLLELTNIGSLIVKVMMFLGANFWHPSTMFGTTRVSTTKLALSGAGECINPSLDGINKVRRRRTIRLPTACC